MSGWKVHLVRVAVSFLWVLFCVLLAVFFDFPLRAGTCYGMLHAPLVGLCFERWLKKVNGSGRRL